MSANKLKADRNPAARVRFRVAYFGKRQELEALMAHVQSTETTTRFARCPEEESFTADGLHPVCEYVSSLWCEQPMKVVDAFREGLSKATKVDWVWLDIPAGDGGATSTVILRGNVPAPPQVM